MIDEDVNAALRPIFGTEVHPLRRRQPDTPLDVPLLPAAIYDRISDDWQAANTNCGSTPLHNVRLQVDVYARPYKQARALAESAAQELDALAGWLRLTKSFFPDDADKASRLMLEYSVWTTE
jgi:hypothetical protein